MNTYEAIAARISGGKRLQARPESDSSEGQNTYQFMAWCPAIMNCF